MAEVLVGMSGGVDSSVAAARLVEAGHSVTGVTLKLWGGDSDSGCCSVSDVEDARRVAHRLGIEHLVFNFGDDFNRHVVDPYVEAYSEARTPNPCIECNRHIKFDKLLRRADALGFDAVATGHHARLVQLGDGERRLARGADAAKDQSYVLYMLDQSQLARLMLPIGDMTKDAVRELATDLGLGTADKPDSQDVCFIHSDGGRRAFLGDRIPLSSARIVDARGRHLGSTDAAELVTLGQRKGLGLAGNADRHYVLDVDPIGGVIIVGAEAETKVPDQAISDVVWTTRCGPGRYGVQAAAHGRVHEADIGPDELRWAEPQRRVAAGQALVFYERLDDGIETVVGGAVAAQQLSATPVVLA